MALGDALAAERDRQDQRGPRCSMCVLLERLPESEADALNAALADEAYTGAAITRALKHEGYLAISPQSLQRHRRGECRK